MKDSHDGDAHEKRDQKRDQKRDGAPDQPARPTAAAAADAIAGSPAADETHRAPRADRILPDAPGSPWRTLGSREVYRNPWFSVVEHDVIRPDGQPGLYCVADPGDNVTIVAVDDEERVCLIRDFVYAFQTFDEFLPTGMVDPGEETLAAARRELLEETGLTASDWSLLGTYRLSPGFSRQTSFIYLARGLTAGPARREPTERMTTRMVPLGAAREAVLRGEIRAAVAVVGIWRVWAALHPDRPDDVPRR